LTKNYISATIHTCLTHQGACMYDIEWINTVKPTATDCPDFETVYAEQLQGISLADDIGGLVVYTRKGAVVAVFDYENECGWLAK
jgi:hypothetical protein